MGKATISNSEKRDKTVEYIHEDNVIDITKNELSNLKLKVTEEENLDTKLAAINDAVEKRFDWVLSNDWTKNITITVNGSSFSDTIENIVMTWNRDKLNALANYVIDSSRYQKELDEIKNNEIKNALKNYKFELNNLRDEVTSSGNITKENQNEAGETNKNNGEKEKEIEHYINPSDLNSTEIESYTYYDFTTEFDENQDGRMSNKELRDAGIVNTYRSNNKDKNTAILGILNEDMAEAFEKADIRGINWDDLTEILEEMLDPMTYAKEHNTDNKSSSLLDLVIKNCDVGEDWDYVWTDTGIKSFKKEFKDVFKENFIKTKKYNSKGIFRDTDKIADLIITAVEGTNEHEFWDALERLADVGDAAKNMDYTAAYNNDVMLRHLQLEDDEWNDASYRVFMFLCDFDSDGIVNSTDIIGRDKQNKKRRDTWSVMGGQLYTNFLQYATTERWNIDWDSEKEKIIVDGPETSNLIKNILLACSTASENDNLKNAIEIFITEQTKDNGQITMVEFMEFMKNTTYTHKWVETNLSSAADIKGYLKTVGEQLNEGKDLSRLFLDKKEIQNNILANIQTSDGIFSDREKQLNLINKNLDLNEGYTNITWTDLPNYDILFASTGEDEAYLDEIKGKANTSTNEFFNSDNLQQIFDEDTLNGVRNTCTYNTIKAINYVTDLIYLRLGKYPGKAIADMFSGTKFGLRYSFYKPDGTINEKEAKKALKAFVSKRTIINVGVGISENNKPVIGASVHRESLSDDLGDKTIEHISGWLDLENLLKGMFPLTFDIGVGKARQINEQKAKRLTTKEPIPVNRIGVETGVNLNSIRDRWLYLWLSAERDFPAGIEQKARYYDKLMKSVLFSYPENTRLDICKNRDEFNKIMRDRITSSENPDIKENKEFLLDMVDKMGDEMEMTWIFELIRNNENNPDLQKKILLYMYMTFIDAFHENAIEQKAYEQLTGTLKLTRFGLKASLANILMRTGVGASLGSVIPGWGTLVGAATGVVTGMFTFSTRKTSYAEDAHGKGVRNYTMIERGIWAQDQELLIESGNKEAIAKYLEKELNPNEKLLEVKIVEDKIEITHIDWKDPTQYINAYYSKSALTNNDFSFDGKKITLSNTSLRVSRDIKRDEVETFLMIGQEDVHDHMTKLSSNTSNTADNVPTLGNMETARYKEMSYTEIKEFVSNDPELNTKKDIILWFFDADGSLKKGLATIPADLDLQGKKISVGTLTFTEDLDGKVSITWYDKAAPSDKMEINYITQEKVNANNTVAINNENYAEAVEINTTDILKPEDRFTKPFTEATERTLSIFDDYYNNTLYREFMESAVDAWLDEFINATDYNAAYTTLIKILEKNSNYANLTEVKNLIESNTLTDADRAFIVDKFKAIFSYIIYLTDGINDGANLTATVNGRKDIYKKMLWPDERTAYPLTTDYRSTIRDLLKGTNKLTRQTMENLIGFTAFYRLNWDGRKYSMTALWATNILSKWDWTKSMAEINKTDLPAAEEWFVNNLNANKMNQQKILTKLNSQLTNYGIALEEKHLESLFSWEYQTIDIWGKIVKLDLQYYFYLLGECANESIGTIINSITIYEQIHWGIKETTINGEILWKKSKMQIQTQTVNAEYDISARQNDLTLSAALSGLFKKHTWEATPWESPESSNTNESVTWWEGGEGDEGSNDNQGFNQQE